MTAVYVVNFTLSLEIISSWADAYRRCDVVRFVQSWDSELELDILSKRQNDVVYRFGDV